ncbi:Lipase, class 3 family-containing protein [Strongyloides ratti]|uniref:Lipase, class 3 family-containing protein n=1 Tax=Strongyloides ratti TaxID=34506 RepID=A0A090MN38_STRRB|nr:Lipase, class 3 family-containing protein [Strongyloides ratti]CEF59466.1 Lipase, class 3 family-containing protein [Strongyloides ratti]
MVGFAAAAYSDNPYLCTNNLKTNFTKQITIGCDFLNDDTCSAFIAVDTKDKAIIISHRGSISGVQIGMEVIETLFDKKESFPSGGGVSRYFYDAWSLVWNGGLRDAFLTAKNKYADYDVWVTGHSLGGAMASLTAANIGYQKYVLKEKLKIITFGEPRVGDVEYAKGFDNVVGYSYRVIHHRDPVPHLPLRNMFNYQHTKEEIFYDNDMSPGSSYKNCSIKDDEKSCSNKYLNFDVSDHSHYFKNIGSILNANCSNLYP